MASMAYAEQVGLNRQAGGKSGDRKRRYACSGAIMSAAMNELRVRVGAGENAAFSGWGCRSVLDQSFFAVQRRELLLQRAARRDGRSYPGNEEEINSCASSSREQPPVGFPEHALRSISANGRSDSSTGDVGDSATGIDGAQPENNDVGCAENLPLLTKSFEIRAGAQCLGPGHCMGSG